MADDNEKRRESALELLDEQRKVYEALRTDTQQVVGMAQTVIDNGELQRDLVLYGALSDEQLDQMADAARHQNDAGRAIGSQIREAKSVVESATTSTSFTVSAAVTGTYAASDGVYSSGFRAGVKPDEIKRVLVRFNVIARGQHLVPLLRAQFIRLGLDRGSKPHRAPLDLLNAGELGFDRPAGAKRTPNESLGPLRQCLDRTVSELYSRCSENDVAGSWEDKVKRIARRASRLGLANGYFDVPARAVGRKLVELTGEKSTELTEEQMMGLYHETLMLLRTIVEGVDEQRLRPVRA